MLPIIGILLPELVYQDIEFITDVLVVIDKPSNHLIFIFNLDQLDLGFLSICRAAGLKLAFNLRELLIYFVYVAD